MPKNLTPENRWETEFQVPLPGEPRNIGPLERLFQRLLNRTERLKNRIGAILGMSWDATPPDTLAGLAGRVGTLESNQGGTTLAAHRTNPVLDHPNESVTSAKLANGAVTAAKIGDGQVMTSKLADGAVTTPKISDGAVTIPKLADGAVTTPKISDGAVTIPKLASVSTEPTPNTLVLRNAQGAVQDGAITSIFRVKKVGGIYGFSGTRWFRLATWSGFFGSYLGIFADLHIRHMSGATSGRLRFRAVPGSTPNPLISVSNHTRHTLIHDAIVKATSSGAYELWIHCAGDIYVEGALGTITGEITLAPYGNVHAITQDTAPTQEGDLFYLRWEEVPIGQTFPGPGYIVSAGRGVNSGYIRHDNGVQVCWGIANVGNGTWIFPAAFTSPPQVQATAETGNAVPRVITLTHVSAVGVGILRTDLSGNVQSGIVHIHAVGLWK